MWQPSFQIGTGHEKLRNVLLLYINFYHDFFFNFIEHKIFKFAVNMCSRIFINSVTEILHDKRL